MDETDGFKFKIIKDVHVEGNIIVSITHNGYQWSSISMTRDELKQVKGGMLRFLRSTAGG
jgi:hypothetical protein